MNRSLGIPAGCCLLAFVALWATFHDTAGRGTAAEPAQFADARRDANLELPLSRQSAPATRTDGEELLSTQAAEQLLTALAGEYLRPWRGWESSPRRLFSRAAPRPIPAIDALVEVRPDASSPGDSFLLATITFHKETSTQENSTGEPASGATPERIDPTLPAPFQVVPCVVDRTTRQVRLFAEGRWLTPDEWLTAAPLPSSTRP